ncbi:DUF4113 domain-containing protein [Halomonas sp. ISL-104]|nr:MULTISPECIES: DUF4113 domain-containing protein [unclassified Halomonas]
MGKGTVRLGLPEKNAPWHLRCANRSPRILRIGIS